MSNTPRDNSGRSGTALVKTAVRENHTSENEKVRGSQDVFKQCTDKILRKPNPKQRKFVKKVIEGESIQQAASLSGYTPLYGHELMKQDSIKLALMVAMEKAGIGDDLMADKMREGLDALAPPRKDGGRQYADFFTRKQYIDMIHRLKGVYAPEEVNINQKVIHIHMDETMARGLVDAQVIDAEEIYAEEIHDTKEQLQSHIDELQKKFDEME